MQIYKMSKLIKYPGADWMASQSIELTPFTASVADILGQVYEGIYHIKQGYLSNRPDWRNPLQIRIVLCDRMSTFDNSRLTVLLLAILKAGISVTLKGSQKGYLALKFCDQSSLQRLQPKTMQRFSNIWTMQEYFSPDAKRLRSHHPKNGGTMPPLEVVAHKGEIALEQLAEIIVCAHHSRIRVEITGQSPNSLRIAYSQRKPSGKIYERHPYWDEAYRILQPYWDAIEHHKLADKFDVTRKDLWVTTL